MTLTGDTMMGSRRARSSRYATSPSPDKPTSTWGSLAGASGRPGRVVSVGGTAQRPGPTPSWRLAACTPYCIPLAFIYFLAAHPPLDPRR
jgi:hypothetical protein